MVGQILDYATELARFTSGDLEREAGQWGVPSLVGRVREAAPDLNETRFHDALSRSLREDVAL